MKYIVIELQTNENGTIGNLVTAHDDRLSAEAKYHAVLSAAAISNLPKHAAVLLDSDGAFLTSQCYEHKVEE